MGEGIRRSGIDRKELFVTSKLWIKEYGYEQAKQAFQASLDRLGLDYLDQYLLHWPFGDTYAAWRDLEKFYEEGKISAIGVSNYTADRLLDLVNYNEILPAVNQIETNLVSQQVETRQWMDKFGVRHQSYAPFGQGHINSIYKDDTLCRIAERYGKTTRQVVLRFLIQSGIIVIPKTIHKERLAENFDVFDFSLLDNEMEILRSYDKATPLIGNPQNPALVESSKNW